MRLKVLVNSTDFSDAALVEQSRITKEISGRVSTAQISFVAGREAVYGSALYDEATYGVDAAELADVELRDQDTDDLLFAGYIAETKRSRCQESPDELQIDCTCSDWTTMLDVVIPEATFTGQTDRAIIQALVSTYAPRLSALTANIASTSTLGSFEIKETTLRNALDELCELTGCEYRVDFTKALHYFVEGTFPAAFDLSTERDEYRIDEYTRDAKGLVNRCIVLGGLLPGGTEIRVQYDDPVSQGLYGVKETTIVDRQISLTPEALLRAQVAVEANAYPLESGTAVTYKDGLDIGQSVDLYHGELAIDGTYLIRSMEMAWLEDKETVQYTIQFGVPKPNLERLLRMLDARNRRATAIPTAVPVEGSVTDASIGSGGLSADVIGSVNAGAIIGTISSTQIGSVNANSIIGLISATQIGSVNATAILGAIQASQIAAVNAGTIQGAITAGQIGSVNATTIQGVIISSQVADDLIDRLSLFNHEFRPLVRLDTDPTLPDTEWPEGSAYVNVTLGVFRKVVSGAWQTVTENDAISGKLSYHYIGTLNAGNIIGLIAAGQINSITASQITGAITSAQISSVSASAIVGSITASQISTVNASAIQGSITSSQIGSVAASTITGTITSSQISTVSASSITGTITSGQIATVSASSITGTLTAGQIASVNATAISGSITATQIGSINAASITIGLVGNSQLASGISASKLTLGTLDASVVTVTNLSASSITTGTMSANRISGGTTSGITITGSTFTSGTISSASAIGSAGDVTANNYLVAGIGVQVSGSTVVNTRKSAIAGPTGGAVVDTQARAVIDLILAAMRASTGHGLIAG